MRQGCWVDLERAEQVEVFFRNLLCHSKGSFGGQPFEFIPWQRELLFTPLFGWVRRDELGDIVRRFLKAYVEIPKKNGKSTIASGIGLYCLIGDGEPGAEVYSVATDRDQANLVHGEAVNMVDASPILSDALRINRATKNILYEATKSFYRALSARPAGNEGLNAHCMLADELHVWTGAKGRANYNALRWAFAARRQPLLFQITTAGNDMLSVCREQHDYALGVINGTIEDTTFFPLIFAAAADDDPWAESTWRKANPSLGSTMTLASFAAAAEEAQNSPQSIAEFKRYRLNIWTTGDSPWLRHEDWKACQREFSAESLAGRRCYAAMDLSRTKDSTSVQLIFPPDDDVDDIVHVLSFFWYPEDEAIVQRDAVPWLLWAEQGYVELIPGAVMEYGQIEAKIAELAQQFEILALVYDPLFANDITLRIENELNIPRIAFAQTITNFAGATAEWERRVLNRTLHHNGHPIMAWQIGNAIIRTDVNNNKRPKKQGPNDPRKIDGVVAGIMGLAQTMTPEPELNSWYDEDGNDVEVG